MDPGLPTTVAGEIQSPSEGRRPRDAAPDVPPEDFRPALVTYVMERHTEGRPVGRCVACTQEWPCDAIRLVRLGGWFDVDPLTPDIKVELVRLYGAARLNRSGLPADHPHRIASLKLSEMLAALKAQGVSLQSLADALGITKAGVNRRLMRHGHKEPAPTVYDIVIPYKGGDLPRRG